MAAAADAAYEIAKPMDNTDFELVWRKKMVRALVTYALRELRGDDMREQRVKIARQFSEFGAGPLLTRAAWPGALAVCRGFRGFPMRTVEIPLRQTHDRSAADMH